MSRRKADLSTPLEISINVLTKLLNTITERSLELQELKIQYCKILNNLIGYVKTKDNNYLQNDIIYNSIPWEKILEQSSKNFSLLNKFKSTGEFSQKEINYMCAMLCGITGKEFEIVTGLKSHYNISWTIRRKLGVKKNSTNIGTYLKSLYE